MSFSHDQNELSFSYSGIHNGDPSRNKFQYKLSPYDENWINAGNERTARYTNLDPSNYYFQVKAANSDGVWSEEKTLATLSINPPWWQTIWAYLFYSMSVLGLMWYLAKWQKQRTIKIEREKIKDKELAQKREIEKAYDELAISHANLKVTQSQLIQAEKMASLGELTAGIAHEIQNPLNFVNNFSEISSELIEEMGEEIVKNDMDEVMAIAKDLKHNVEKISQHGRRADAIVKSMLQHSRKSTGQKEAIDINKLCDEYLHLSYHGLRAKDSSFNSGFETNFASELPKVSAIPQDIGRVLLNLFNNAFYAVNERSKQENNSYNPTVIITTSVKENFICISIVDNGNGIPAEISEKIFQPFFTTKPTGQGIGLGLSLSYDIIKAHGGKLEVESEKNKGSTFLLYLPV
jgi:signal transduction histidine kinase